MNSITVLLNKILVRQFYRLNAGFFLLIGTLTFGFMSGVEHKALAEFFVSAPQVLLIPIAVWSIYWMKIIAFNKQQLELDENRAAFNIPFLPLRQQLSSIGVCFVLQFLPALLYGLFLCLVATSLSGYTSLLMIAVSLAVYCASGIFIIKEALGNTHRERKISFLKQFLDHHLPKPVVQFYADWLLRSHPILLAG